MGYIIHHAIVVTGIDLPAMMASEPHNGMTAAHAKAVELGMSPTPLVKTEINGYLSFMVPPDGSKEGWEASVNGDKRRDALIDYMRTLCYSDGSSSVHWVEVQFGGDEPGRNTAVTRGYGLRRGKKKVAA